MGRVVHFEIHADDPERAKGFYGECFGWKFEGWGSAEYWAVTTGDPATPGINGGLMKRRGPRPTDGAALNAFACTIDVADLEATEARVKALGGKVVVPRAPIPGVGWLSYCNDPEGNIVGLLQSDPNAK